MDYDYKKLFFLLNFRPNIHKISIAVYCLQLGADARAFEPNARAFEPNVRTFEPNARTFESSKRAFFNKNNTFFPKLYDFNHDSLAHKPNLTHLIQTNHIEYP